MKISDAVGAVDAVKAVIEGMHTDANVNAQNQLNALSALANAVATDVPVACITSPQKAYVPFPDARHHQCTRSAL